MKPFVQLAQKKTEKNADCHEAYIQNPIWTPLLNEARYLKNTLGKSKEAMNVCERILNSDPSCRDALLIKTGALKELFLLDEAEKLANQIVQKWPMHWEGYYLLALNHFSQNRDEEGFKNIDKSIELNENFDNLITKAQMFYLLGKGNYLDYVEKARKKDKKRTENFMKNHFIYDENTVKPTWSELFRSLRCLIKKKR